MKQKQKRWLTGGRLSGVPSEIASITRYWHTLYYAGKFVEHMQWPTELNRRGWNLRFADGARKTWCIEHHPRLALEGVRWSEKKGIPPLSAHERAAGIRAGSAIDWRRLARPSRAAPRTVRSPEKKRTGPGAQKASRKKRTSLRAVKASGPKRAAKPRRAASTAVKSAARKAVRKTRAVSGPAKKRKARAATTA